MKKILYALIIGMVAMGMSACKGGESISTNPASLQGDWTATAMNGQQLSGKEYTISFNTDETVAGIADCNRFAGTYSAMMEGKVSMNDVSKTGLDCNSKSNDYLNFVTSANSFKVMGGDRLQLSSSSNSGNIIFTKVMTEAQED